MKKRLIIIGVVIGILILIGVIDLITYKTRVEPVFAKLGIVSTEKDNSSNEKDKKSNENIYTKFDMSVEKMKSYINKFDLGLEEDGALHFTTGMWQTYKRQEDNVAIRTYYAYDYTEIATITIRYENENNIMGIMFLGITPNELETKYETLYQDYMQVLYDLGYFIEMLTGDKELNKYYFDLVTDNIIEKNKGFTECKKGICFLGGRDEQGRIKTVITLEKYKDN